MFKAQASCEADSNGNLEKAAETAMWLEGLITEVKKVLRKYYILFFNFRSIFFTNPSNTSFRLPRVVTGV